MAYHRVEDGPWPRGVTVAAWLTSSLVGGQPVGNPVATGVADADGVVSFGGLTEGASYTAFGSGGQQEFVAQNLEATLALVTGKASKANLPINVGDYGTTEAAVLEAIAAVPAYGAVEFVPGATYTLTDRLPVTANGVTLIGNGCRIRQSTVQKPCFDVAADDVTIDGFDFAFTGTKAYSATSYRGGQLYTGQAGVVSSGNRTVIRHCRGANLVAVAMHRDMGPAVDCG